MSHRVDDAAIATAVAKAAADAACPEGNEEDVGGLRIVW